MPVSALSLIETKSQFVMHAVAFRVLFNFEGIRKSDFWAPLLNILARGQKPQHISNVVFISRANALWTHGLAFELGSILQRQFPYFTDERTKCWRCSGAFPRCPVWQWWRCGWSGSPGPRLCPMDTASGRGLFNPFLPSSAVNKDRHFSCEDCNGNVSGGFDSSVSQVGVLPSCFLSSSSPHVCWVPSTCQAFYLVDFVQD